MRVLSKILFALGFLLSLTGYVSPPFALTAGILFGLSFPHPYISESRGIARILLQGSVVALGFGMNLHEVLRAGRSGFLYTALRCGSFEGGSFRFDADRRSFIECRTPLPK
jgi:uncharacterized membrane protein YadS